MADTDDKMLERAAHIMGCYDAWRAREICAEEGIPEQIINEGARISEIRRDIRMIINRTWGSPEYGRSPAAAEDIRKFWQEECAKRGIPAD